MESNTFKIRIKQFHEKQYRYWMGISVSLFLLSLLALFSLGIKQIRFHAALKSQYALLIKDATFNKDSSHDAKQRTKYFAVLNKQSLLFKHIPISPTLLAISRSIPASVYLTNLCITDTVTLKGYAPDMLTLTQFTAHLEKQFEKVMLKESAVEKDAVSFCITTNSKQ